MNQDAVSRLFRPLFLAGVLLSIAPLAHADEGMDRLVRLVGPDAGLCLEVPRLDETLTAFEQGEFFRRLEHSKIYADWKASRQEGGIANVAAFVKILSAKPARRFVRDVLGTAVVIAAYTDPGPKISAILLSQATSRESLAAAIKAWIAVEECRIEAVQFAGQTYHKRICSAKTEHAGVILYYATLDRTLLLSDREDLVRRALTLASPNAAHATLFDLPAYQQSRRALTTNCAVRAYINPRKFDEILGIGPDADAASSTASVTPANQAGAARQTPPSVKSSVCKVVEAAWRRFEWLALGIEIDRGIVLEGVAHYSSVGLSKEAQRFIQSVSGPPEILRWVPPNACVVLAFRQPFGGLFRGTLKRQARQWLSGNFDAFRRVSRGLLLGFDLFDNIVPLIRGNVGGYLVPRYGAKPGELPFEGLLAAELREPQPAAEPKTAVLQPAQLAAVKEPVQSSLRPPVATAVSKPVEIRPSAHEAIENALTTGLNYLAARFNMASSGPPAVVRTELEQSSGIQIRWVDGLKVCQPAYAQTPRYLLLGTGPRLVHNFIVSQTIDKRAPLLSRHACLGELLRANRSHKPSSIQELAARYFPNENQVVYVDTAVLRRMVAAHRAELVQYATSTQLISAAAAEEMLSKCLDLAGTVDKVFAATRLGDGTARVVIGGIVNAPAASESAAAR
jgi:hypothetical protein